jgi:DNA-binding MarR family transcriptional regulator
MELEMDSRVIAELVLHLGRMASGDGLSAAQWVALRYIERANRFSRTPSAFATFHGTTRGTVSQTIKSLETQGYLTRTQSETDKRSCELALTDKARTILLNDSFEVLVRAADALPTSVRSNFVTTLHRMLNQVAKEKGTPTFGTCTSCEHLEGNGCNAEGKESYACGFMSEPLLLKELDELCINFVQGKFTMVTNHITGDASQ